MARILAIDYGLRRVGLAVTDPLQIITRPLDTVDAESAADSIQSYCELEEVEAIVVGYPSHPDGSPLDICPSIDRFIDELKNRLGDSIRYIRYDENYSSAEAMRMMIEAGVKKSDRRDKALLDRMSAVVILRRYLGHDILAP